MNEQEIKREGRAQKEWGWAFRRPCYRAFSREGKVKVTPERLLPARGGKGGLGPKERTGRSENRNDCRCRNPTAGGRKVLSLEGRRWPEVFNMPGTCRLALRGPGVVSGTPARPAPSPAPARDVLLSSASCGAEGLPIFTQRMPRKKSSSPRLAQSRSRDRQRSSRRPASGRARAEAAGPALVARRPGRGSGPRRAEGGRAEA